MSNTRGRFPLFKGAIRVPTKFGVPRTVLLVNFMLAGALFPLLHLWSLGLFFLLHFICWCITKNDDRAFRILYLAWKTKVVNRIDSPFTKLWGGSTYSPRDYRGKD